MSNFSGKGSSIQFLNCAHVVCGLLLCATAFSKLLTAFNDEGVAFLAMPDPLIPLLSNRQVLFVAGLLEGIVGIVAVNLRVGFGNRTFWLSWLTATLVAYRAALYSMGFHSPCACLGGAAEWMGLNDTALRLGTMLLLVFFALTALASVATLAGCQRGPTSVRFGGDVRTASVVLIFLGSMAFASANKIVVAEGLVSVSGYNNAGVIFTNFALPFNLKSNFEGIWIQRVNYSPSQFTEFGSDGTNVYSYLHTYFAGTETLPALLPAVVVPGRYPHIATSYERLLWLAYSTKQSALSESIDPVWLDSFMEPMAHAYEASVVWNESFPFAVESVTWRTTSPRIKEAGSNSNLVSTVTEGSQRVKQLLERDFLGGDYRVLQWTNISGLMLPALSQLRQYAVPDGSLFLVYDVRLSSTSVADNEELPGHPSLGSFKLGVTDYRLRDSRVGMDYIQYPVTNGIWKVEVSAEMQSAFQEKRARMERLNRRPLLTKQTALTLFFGVVICPLIWWFFRSRNSTQNT